MQDNKDKIRESGRIVEMVITTSSRTQDKTHPCGNI